jgi:hypothetical protein
VVPKLGIGLVYASIPRTNLGKPDPDNNEPDLEERYRDTPFRQGLHLDLLFSLAVNINLTESWQLSPSIGYNYMPPLTAKEDYQEKWDMHFKMLTAGLALGYTPNPCLVHYPETMLNSKRSRIDIAHFVSAKRFEPKDGGEEEYCYIGGLSAKWSIKVCNTHAITLGTEWFYDGAKEKLFKDQPSLSPLTIGLLLGHEFRWGKVIFGQEVGFYAMNHMPTKEDFYLYARLGMDYRITDCFFVGTSMKALVAATEDQFAIRADFIDFRIGYSF